MPGVVSVVRHLRFQRSGAITRSTNPLLAHGGRPTRCGRKSWCWGAVPHSGSGIQGMNLGAQPWCMLRRLVFSPKRKLMRQQASPSKGTCVADPWGRLKK